MLECYINLLNTLQRYLICSGRPLARSEGGLGLGLTLVKQIIERHAGRVAAQSRGLGQGSTFMVWLPVLNNTNHLAETDTNFTRMHPLNRILIVDDNADSSFTLGMLLELKGYEVHTRNSGKSALESLSEVNPDIILLDIGMPELDGYETCQLIRQHPLGSSVCVIALSGYGQGSDKQRSIDAGFNQHLTKPVDLEVLIETISNR